MRSAAALLITILSFRCLGQNSAKLPGDLAKFVPGDAELVKYVDVNLSSKYPTAVVLAYGWNTTPFVKVGVRIIKKADSGYSIAYDETASLINGAGLGDAIDIEKVASSAGTDGVVVVLKTSGAGTTSDWYVLTGLDPIVKLDPGGIREAVLKRRGYVFMGYNGIKTSADQIIEDISGYSGHTARCCPDLPTLVIRTRFTGTSLKLAGTSTVSNSP